MPSAFFMSRSGRGAFTRPFLSRAFPLFRCLLLHGRHPGLHPSQVTARAGFLTNGGPATARTVGYWRSGLGSSIFSQIPGDAEGNF
jgi:hypothetical protein